MTDPVLCVTVAARSIEDLRRQRDEASRLADLVELRLDALGAPDVIGALADRTGPVLVTCRPRWEGGGFDGPEEVRLDLLRQAIDLGAEFVDVEWRADHRGLVSRRAGRGIVLSLHDFDNTPPALDATCRAMWATGAEVVKLATRAHALRDCLPLLAIGREGARGGRRTALVAMGPAGLASRLVPGRFGSCWSYAGDGVAPGQVTAGRMLDEFRFREVGAATKLFAVVGRPVGHSLSPLMHNAAFRGLGIDAVYLPLEAADAADFLEFAAAIGLSGASVTAPFKTALLEAAVPADEVTVAVGALNTLSWADGRWMGRNTDVAGFLAPLTGVGLEGMRAAVLGTGGAARAVVAGLVARGAKVTVYGREAGRAAEVVRTAPGTADARVGLPTPGTWDLLVNTTPAGTAPNVDESPIDGRVLSGGIVYDLVYNPARTRLIREAEAAGCRTIGGLDMLVAQAALQFEWWTGREAPAGLMHEAAAARLHTMAGGQ
jgi:3-dehydroquinate dehydratase/shikimate dehydrogenase